MSTQRTCWIAVCLVMLLATGCRSTSETQVEEPTADESTSELEQLYWARQDSARMSFTEADVSFMTGMITHHAQAVVMSRLASSHGASEQVQTLAARIINSQQDEIDLMQRWLRERDQPVPQIEMDGTKLTVNGESVHGMPMAGILTEEQIHELDAARGAEFDRLFLDYMIEHHSGAVTMVDTLFSTDGAAQDGAAFKLASDIHAAQKTEIARMERMLEDRTGASRNR